MTALALREAKDAREEEAKHGEEGRERSGSGGQGSGEGPPLGGGRCCRCRRGGSADPSTGELQEIRRWGRKSAEVDGPVRLQHEAGREQHRFEEDECPGTDHLEELKHS